MARSTRTLVAVILYLFAAFLAINNLVLGSTLGDWLLPLIVFIAGLTLSLYPGQVAEAEAPAESAPLAAPQPMPTLAVAPSKPIPSLEPAVSAPAVEPTVKAAEVVEPDNLTKINGVGPKMQEALRAAGFDTFAKIAASNGDELRAVIEAAGMRLAPTIDTWPEQARELMK